MIHYYFFKNIQKTVAIEISGHALYAVKGLDIVCASVSTAIIVTLNALEMLGCQKDISYKLKKNFFKLAVVNNQNNNVFVLLNNLEYTLDNLSKQYHNYLKKISIIHKIKGK